MKTHYNCIISILALIGAIGLGFFDKDVWLIICLLAFSLLTLNI